jgi:C4-dicarboxylate-specific signal transduction histidine kinase
MPDRDHLVARLKRIARQVDKASALVSHLKVFGRHEVGEASEVFEPTRVVEDALLVMRGPFADMGIDAQVSGDASGVAARGRPVIVEQALVNLLSNAADAIGQRMEREPGFVGRISIRIYMVEPGLVGIAVADNGGGVPPEAADRIFEPFFTTKSPGKGTGLGLSVSRRALREMGGDIVFASEGEGAKFSLELPAA